MIEQQQYPIDDDTSQQIVSFPGHPRVIPPQKHLIAYKLVKQTRLVWKQLV